MLRAQALGDELQAAGHRLGKVGSWTFQETRPPAGYSVPGGRLWRRASSTKDTDTVVFIYLFIYVHVYKNRGTLVMDRFKKERGWDIEKLRGRFEGKGVLESHMDSPLKAFPLIATIHCNYPLLLATGGLMPTLSVLGFCLPPACADLESLHQLL